MTGNLAEKVLAVIPTYQERESLPDLLARLHAAQPDADVLVVDDSSPDGTGEWAAEFASRNRWLSVLSRPSKSGLASAYIDGFRWGMDAGYDLLAQMDADGSHRPQQLGRLLYRVRAADRPPGVIGSRWTPGGRAEHWTPGRRFLSVGGNLYIRALLGMPVRDATAGFRVYRAAALRESKVLDNLECRGYGYQVEMTYRLFRAGYKLVEVPTSFADREAGESKMSPDIAIEQLCQISRWGLQRLLDR